MNETHLHLLFNHVSILGVVFSSLLALSGLIFRSLDLKKAALAGMLLSSLATVLVFKTGEGAEESVEQMPGISESSIEEHEEAADLALWVTLAAGTLAGLALFVAVKRKALPANLFLSVVVIGLVASGFLVRTGLLGGRIHHTEIGSNPVPAAGSAEEGEDD